jgi:hypothetical protein
MSDTKYAVAGLGNALMDALIVMDSDDFLGTENLNKGIMHPVDHERWMGVYSKLDSSKVVLQTGGSCANTIAAMGLMGAKVSYCGHLGNDEFGSTYASQFVDACGEHSLILGEGHTGKCLSLVSQDAERTMLTDLGTSVMLPSIEHFKKVIAESQVLYSTGYLLLGDPMKSRLIEAAEFAKAQGVLIALDVADPFVVKAVTADMKDFIDKYCDLVFLNEEEAKAITGSDEATDAIEELKGMCDTIVVKLGKKGAVVYSKGEIAKTGVKLVKPIDTTGAGDSFAAGFLFGFTHGYSLEKSVQLATHIAAETIIQVGAVVRTPNRLREIVEEVC